MRLVFTEVGKNVDGARLREKRRSGFGYVKLEAICISQLCFTTIKIPKTG